MPAVPVQDSGRATTLVVLSCDKYSDLWPIYFQLFFKYWPACPFPVCLAGNQKRYDDPRVTTLLSGDDQDWSSSVRRSVDQIRSKYILMMIDDALLIDPVDTAAVTNIVGWAIENSARYVRFRSTPRPDKKHDEKVGVISPGVLYRTALFPSLWERETFLDLLSDGESAWEFEMKGTVRSNRYEDFYGTWGNHFHCIHGVEKGLWLRSAVSELRRRGLQVDLRRRREMTRTETAVWQLNKSKGMVLNLLPAKWRPTALRAVQAAYRFVGLRR